MKSSSIIDNTDWPLHWQMSPGERCALQVVLQRRRPALSIEVGTYRGGSLQVICEHSHEVISLDIDPAVPASLTGLFKNAEYRVGDSQTVLPELVEELNRAGRAVGFVLIDGDHSAGGVRRDIEAILRLDVRERLVILMHDSFNPECRRGMRSVNWAANPHVHMVELDFTVGSFHANATDTAVARSMWGGFGCAVLEPAPRVESLVIGERQRGLFDAVYPRSVHATGPGRTVAEQTARRAWRTAKRLFASRATR